MKNATIVGLVLLTLSCSRSKSAVSGSTEPTDHGTLLSQQGADATLWQHTSAEAYWLYEQIYMHATAQLEANVTEIDEERQMTDPALWIRQPLAVIVDIDETVLDNSPYQVSAIRHGRTFDQNEWRAWTNKAEAKACPGALGFLQNAKVWDCEIFYISNRDVRERASTLKNLQSVGFPFADEAHLLLMEGTSDKSERRARVAATHRVVLLVGDQLRDFDERFKDRSANYGRDTVDAMNDTLSQYFILLPNPMYGTYRDAIQGNGSDAQKQARMKAWFEINGY